MKKHRAPSFSDSLTMWIGSVSSLVVHTLFFGVSFAFVLAGVALDDILLIVTTVVSLEAIYLAIFIQMAINKNTQSLEEVEEDLDEIQEDLGEIQEDIDEIQEDVDEIQEDVDEMEKEDDEVEERDHQQQQILNKIEAQLQELRLELEKSKKRSA